MPTDSHSQSTARRRQRLALRRLADDPVRSQNAARDRRDAHDARLAALVGSSDAGCLTPSGGHDIGEEIKRMKQVLGDSTPIFKGLKDRLKLTLTTTKPSGVGLFFFVTSRTHLLDRRQNHNGRNDRIICASTWTQATGQLRPSSIALHALCEDTTAVVVEWNGVAQIVGGGRRSPTERQGYKSSTLWQGGSVRGVSLQQCSHSWNSSCASRFRPEKRDAQARKAAVPGKPAE